MRFYTSMFAAAQRASMTLKGPAMARSYSAYAGASAGRSSILKFASFALPAAAAGAAYYQYASPVQNDSSSTEPKKFALDPSQFIDFKLLEVEEINHNTKLFRFELPEGETLGMSVASCVITKVPKAGGKGVIIRPYTPTSDDDTVGHFDMIIKKYPNGPMSEHIHNMKPGDTLAVKGPFPKYTYKPNTLSHIGMIAGGTGITPMLQVIRKVFKNPEDKTKITLVFANVNEDDILLRDELDKLAMEHPEQFKLYYTLDNAPKGWTQGQGRVNAEVVKDFMPKPAEDTMVFVCGPDPMVASLSGAKNPDKSQGALGGILKELGYTESNVYKF
ncbi:putative NADH-cytochrome b5 reductase [Basidiobolus meristosporus CBS 931.73]|uniref:NADH-cytochrome b5 reductase n=1 Tax=Basidiobolus meristosporus CBS 931.73 TaxID=1314790 RepID=A0A1Y1Y340_9FUNG|nr:putative NADH-cytochrome b5 reductase [Basidiobolus meristosporus CBS 931.73]|eukprot:ORX92399.1 putative NADH-cytochrome b5 reductase [Basidiobolus meristosporus CBS 931.73]